MRRLLFCLFMVFALPLVGARAQTLDSAFQLTPVTNANSSQLSAIQNALDEWNRRLAAHDATTLSTFGLAHSTGPRAVRARVAAAAVSPTGALVRVQWAVWGASSDREVPRMEKNGVLDVWLARTQNGFTLTDRRWNAPAPALEALGVAADEEWGISFGPDSAQRDAEALAAHSGELLHLVAERRGGRWLALRRSRWDGVIVTPTNLGKYERDTVSTRDWLRRQMNRFGGAGTAHFVMQKGAKGWAGIDAIFDPDRNAVEETDNAAARLREALAGLQPKATWLQATAHRDYANALSSLGLYAEAADQAEKAELMQPGIFGDTRLRQFAANRSSDPLALAIWQVQNESRIGIGFDHPVYVLSALAKKEGAQPGTLGALQIGLEYSKLAQDKRAASWLAYADALIAKGALKYADINDVQWAGILRDQLDERRRYAAYKPANIIRSGLFTVRCWVGDLNTVQLLAGLETAQHTVYADFSVPMGNTEVILWRNQSEFQTYTGRAAGQATSEFIAALTLTKLVASQSGPVVLGEEVNVFTDPRANMVGTIAHEYGHVAVRHIANARNVPTWFNEGIATLVEGGYDGYRERVRNAAARGALISMAEMQTWNVDGERAFLAYSQANSICDYIATRWGRDSILEILRQIGRDVPPETAFRSVLKISTNDLWNRWRAQIK